MSGLRVIGGSAKGRRLKTKQTKTLRPATDYVKEALFDILATRVPESSFLDLFSGSGCIGIEALSRGAKHAVFVEKEPEHGALIRENLGLTGFSGESELLQMDVFQAIALLRRKKRLFDIVFVDPPFRHGLVVPTLEQLLRAGIVVPGGLIVTRTAVGEELETALPSARQSRYGDSILNFFPAPDDPAPKEGRGV
jgi:16S rRNA (guanine966-N2)-methyltransferase